MALSPLPWGTPTFLPLGWSPPEGQVEEGHPEQTSLEASSSEGHTLHANSASVWVLQPPTWDPSLRNWVLTVFILIINTFSPPLIFFLLGKDLEGQN